MSSELAGRAENLEKSDLPEAYRRELGLKDAVARLFGREMDLPEVARRVYQYLEPDESLGRRERLKRSRATLRRWQNQLEFRNLIWHYSVQNLDLQTPAILNGVARKARGGRVDAAKLALEITGRHTSKPEVQPASVSISFGDVPRPREISAATMDGEETIELPAEEIGE